MKTSRLAKTFALSALGSVLVPGVLGAATINVTNSADDGSPGTLRYVLKNANDGDVIQIPATTIVLTNAGAAALDTDGNADLDVKKSLTIQGVDAASTTIDADGPTTNARVFDIDPDLDGASLSLRGLTVQNGNAAGSGGGILVGKAGFLEIRDSIVIGNTASSDGGGVAVANNAQGNATIVNVQFLNNTAQSNGGGLYLDCGSEWGGSAVVNDSLFQGNKAKDDGGGIDVECGNLDSDNTRFVDNEAGTDGTGGGGGIMNDYSAMTLTNCEFNGNSSQGNGGGLYNDYNVYMDGCVITGNKAENGGDGGGIYTNDQMYVTNTSISANSAESDGGGIDNDEALTADGITVTDNVSDFDQDDSGDGGGGISTNFSLVLLNSIVSGNTANNPSNNGNEQGGGGILSYDFLTVINTTVANNTVVGGDGSEADGGGGIFECGDNAIIANSTITGNKVLTDNDGSGDDPIGGGIYACDTISITNSTIANNRADGHGGGIFNDTSMTLNNVTITGNVADANEGGDSGGDGGGLYNVNNVVFGDEGSVLLNNSIIAGNTDASAAHEAPDCANDFLGAGGVLQAGSPSIIQNLTGCNVQGLADKILNVDPQFDASGLADNGGVLQGVAPGSAGQSILLQAGSPAIDAGDDSVCPDKDQRGEARPVGEHCDLGAIETSGSGGTTGGETGGETGGGTTTGGSSGSGGCSLIR